MKNEWGTGEKIGIGDVAIVFIAHRLLAQGATGDLSARVRVRGTETGTKSLLEQLSQIFALMLPHLLFVPSYSDR